MFPHRFFDLGAFHMARPAARHKNDIPSWGQLSGKFPIGRADDAAGTVALDSAADLLAGSDAHPDGFSQKDTVDIAGRSLIFHDIGDQTGRNVVFPLGVQACEISILI